MQIHVGGRMLVQAFWSKPEVEVVRYLIAWVPNAELKRIGGPHHCADLVTWFGRTEFMTQEEVSIAAQLEKFCS